MKDCPETYGNLRKPAAEVSGRFPAGFHKIDKITGIFSCKTCHSRSGITSDFGFLLETCWKPPRPVSGGFRRFPDNPSLTNHKVHKHFSNLYLNKNFLVQNLASFL